MTPEQLNELERLANAATPGPWEVSEPVADEDSVVSAAFGRGRVCSVRSRYDEETDHWIMPPFDARFIAAARTAVPDIIAEVRRLTKNLEDWTLVAKSMSHTAQQHSRECDRLRAENAALQAALRTPQP